MKEINTTSVESIPADRDSTTHTPDTLQIKIMPQSELVNLYHSLDAPTFSEMNGEYAAMLLDQGTPFENRLTNLFVNIYGKWLCKAFTPIQQNEGYGYNSFMGKYGVIRKLRMRTYVGPTKLDGDQRNAFHLVYAPYNKFSSQGLIGAVMHTMFDEIRKVREGLYLGIGRVGFNERALSKLHPFILEGPVAPFVDPE